MSSRATDWIAATAAMLKPVANFAVFIFLIWSTYFATDIHIGLIKGILAFVAVSIFAGTRGDGSVRDNILTNPLRVVVA